MQAQNETLSFCVPGASDLQREYLKVHGYLALMICILGSIANCINIAVLSRREMASSTNSILTGLAVADLLVMLEYIPFALHMYIQIGTQINLNTYGWAVFVYFHSIFSQTFHTIAIWLTVMLAVWRYIAIAFPQRNRSWCDANRTRLAIISSYLICPFICLPIYFAMNIVKLKITAENNTEFAEAMSLPENRTIYVLQMNENRAFVTAIFWMYSVILKLIPCLALSVLSLCLISKLAATEKRRQLLMKSNSSAIQNEAERKCLNAAAAASARRSARTDRTTRMLLAVLGLFLLTEFPQGLFGLISALAPHFFETCYAAFGEVMDMLALISSSVNFVLYCSMSRQFRTTFARLAGTVCVPSPDSRKKVMRGMELATQTTGQM